MAGLLGERCHIYYVRRCYAHPGIEQMNTAPQTDEIQWINRYFEASGLLDYDHLKPILCFSLIWNLFETDACHCRANLSSIRRAVNCADQSDRLSHSRYNGFLIYFRTRYLTKGQTFETFFNALLMTNGESQTVVRRALAGEARDLNNIVYALLLIAHRIRNNLFHGNKAVHTLPQQTELFTAVNSLLTTFLEDIRNLKIRYP